MQGRAAAALQKVNDALLAGADLDTEPDENDTSALHARMEKIHRLIKHLHAFRVALRKAKLEDEDLSGAVEEKIKDLKKALKVLPAMEEARARPCSTLSPSDDADADARRALLLHCAGTGGSCGSLRASSGASGVPRCRPTPP